MSLEEKEHKTLGHINSTPFTSEEITAKFPDFTIDDLEQLLYLLHNMVIASEKDEELVAKLKILREQLRSTLTNIYFNGRTVNNEEVAINYLKVARFSDPSFSLPLSEEMKSADKARRFTSRRLRYLRIIRIISILTQIIFCLAATPAIFTFALTTLSVFGLSYIFDIFYAGKEALRLSKKYNISAWQAFKQVYVLLGNGVVWESVNGLGFEVQKETNQVDNLTGFAIDVPHDSLLPGAQLWASGSLSSKLQYLHKYVNINIDNNLKEAIVEASTENTNYLLTSFIIRIFLSSLVFTGMAVLYAFPGSLWLQLLGASMAFIFGSFPGILTETWGPKWFSKGCDWVSEKFNNVYEWIKGNKLENDMQKLADAARVKVSSPHDIPSVKEKSNNLDLSTINTCFSSSNSCADSKGTSVTLASKSTVLTRSCSTPSLSNNTSPNTMVRSKGEPVLCNANSKEKLNELKHKFGQTEQKHAVVSAPVSDIKLDEKSTTPHPTTSLLTAQVDSRQEKQLLPSDEPMANQLSSTADSIRRLSVGSTEPGLCKQSCPPPPINLNDDASDTLPTPVMLTRTSSLERASSEQNELRLEVGKGSTLIESTTKKSRVNDIVTSSSAGNTPKNTSHTFFINPGNQTTHENKTPNSKKIRSFSLLTVNEVWDSKTSEFEPTMLFSPTSKPASRTSSQPDKIKNSATKLRITTSTPVTPEGQSRRLSLLQAPPSPTNMPLSPVRGNG